MNILEKLFRRKINIERENYRVIRARIAYSEKAIHGALKRLGRPVTAREIARELGWDSSLVTPRMPKMVRKGTANLPFTKKGLDGITRNYYTVGNPNKKF
jgi:DNA-binding MarR family transcriptional regulator